MISGTLQFLIHFVLLFFNVSLFLSEGDEE